MLFKKETIGAIIGLIAQTFRPEDTMDLGQISGAARAVQMDGLGDGHAIVHEVFGSDEKDEWTAKEVCVALDEYLKERDA